MLGLWSAAFYHHIDDLEYDANLGPGPNAVQSGEEDARGRKRQRRSIFFAEPDSDSDDAADGAKRQSATPLSHLKDDNLQLKLAVVPATPYAANPVCKGTCVLTPSFPRRSSSPCLASSNPFVAVHEEANSGFRNYMEDRSAAMTADGVAYLGIYDGHGGVDASTFLQRHLLPTIQAHLRPGCDVHDALTAAYTVTNAAFRATGSIQGSTATTIILKNRRLIAANVGDSPAFVVKKSGEVYSVIQEHKIEGEEAARIAAQGVPIYRSPTGPAYMGTPDGTRWLNMSRAFGDFVYPAISCEPHVCSLDVSDGRFLVMGSDGLTEKWPVAEAAQYLSQLAAAGWSLSAICRSLVERSLACGSTDNISCMIVDLEAYMTNVEPTDAVAPTECEASVRRAMADGEGPDQEPLVRPDLDSEFLETRPLMPPDVQEENERQRNLQECEEHDWQQRLYVDDAGNDNDGVQQLICDETPGEEPRAGGLRWQPRCDAGRLASAPSHASCVPAAVSAIGDTAVEHPAVAAQARGQAVTVSEVPALAVDLEIGPKAVEPTLSPTCGSPDGCEQRGICNDGTAAEGENTRTSQSLQAAGPGDRTHAEDGS